jgi:uncharacterized protein YacL
MKKLDKIIMLITRIIMFAIGVVVGFFSADLLYELVQEKALFGLQSLSFGVFCGLLMVLFGLIGLIIAYPLGIGITKGVKVADHWLRQLPLSTLLACTVGLTIGLLIAALLSSTVRGLPVVGPYMPALLAVLFGYFGISLGYRWRDSVGNALNGLRRLQGFQDRGRSRSAEEEPASPAAVALPKGYKTKVRPKVIDTSAIIDGRIAEICKAGFLEGPVIIPQFVLDELRHIADSGDSLKRARGRRGLDVLNELQKQDVEVINVDTNYPDIREVDAKLVRLAKDLGGCVVTNDFNLNKVASFQKVPTLNVNELAGAIKTVVLPGETMRVEIVSRGKEAGQGVGYLDDGTMIVVENGEQAIGSTVETVVTSVIQTNAGRMIFVRLDH